MDYLYIHNNGLVWLGFEIIKDCDANMAKEIYEWIPYKNEMC